MPSQNDVVVTVTGVRDSHNSIVDIYYEVIDILKGILIRDILDICNFHSAWSKYNYRYLELEF